MSYISQLEHELVRAGRAHHQRRMHLPGLSPSGVVLAAAGVGALALALLALALLRHGPAGHPAGPSAVPADARGLVSQLAILRRRQTAADRAFRGPAHVGALEFGLTRLALDAQGLKVWVVVQRADPLGPHGLWPARDGAQAALVADVDGRRYWTLPVPAAALRDPAMAINAGGWFVELVPDGVARVRWAVPVKTGAYIARGSVSGNVAYAHIGAAGAPVGKPAGWFDAAGGAVSTTPGLVTKHAAERRARAEAANRLAATRQHYAVPASLVRNFPTLLTGPVVTAGLTVTRPGVAHLPDAVLKMATGTQTRIDPRSILQVAAKDGLRFWIEPGENGICLAAPSGANGFEGTCPPDVASTLRTGVWSTFSSPGGTSMRVGVVPKTNTSVTFDLKGGGSRTVPVLDGLVITPDAGITVTHMRGADGRMRP